MPNKYLNNPQYVNVLLPLMVEYGPDARVIGCKPLKAEPIMRDRASAGSPRRRRQGAL